MIPLPALLAEIRSAGPCPEPEGERMSRRAVDYASAGIPADWPILRGLRQLRADLSRLAAEVEWQSKEIAELRLRQLPAKNLNKDDPW